MLTGRVRIEETHYTSQHGGEHIVVQVSRGSHAHCKEHVSSRSDEYDAAYYQCCIYV